MNELDRFIQRATRGLWGQQRQNAQAELRSHLFERTRHHQLLGASETDAQTRALRDLGDPRAIRRGLNQVHTLPTALTLTTLLGLALGGSVLVLTRATAQVSAYLRTDTRQITASYLDVQDLRQQLLKGGATLSGSTDNWIIQIPGQGAARIVSPPASFQAPALLVQQNSRELLNAEALLQAFLQAGVPTRITGWTNPTVTAGTLRLTLGTAQAPFNAYGYYVPGVALIRSEVRDFNLPLAFSSLSSSRIQREQWNTYQLQVNAPAGEIYALVTVDTAARLGAVAPPSERAILLGDIAPVAADGTLTFHLPTLRAIELGTTLSGLKRDVNALNRSGGEATASAAWKPHAGVLLALTGQLQSPTPPYAIVSRTDVVKAQRSSH